MTDSKTPMVTPGEFLQRAREETDKHRDGLRAEINAQIGRATSLTFVVMLVERIGVRGYMSDRDLDAEFERQFRVGYRSAAQAKVWPALAIEAVISEYRGAGWDVSEPLVHEADIQSRSALREYTFTVRP